MWDMFSYFGSSVDSKNLISIRFSENIKITFIPPLPIFGIPGVEGTVGGEG